MNVIILEIDGDVFIIPARECSEVVIRVLEPAPKIGWSKTSLRFDTKDVLSRFFLDNPRVSLYRDEVVKGQAVRMSSTRKYKCSCCGNSVRATKEVSLICAECSHLYQKEILYILC